MAVFEIAQRKLKADPALVKDVEEELAPGLIAALQKGGVSNALRGYLVTDDGRDVSGEYREFFFMEWPSVQHFRDFVVSPALREQGAKMAGYIEGSTNLKLFQTSGGSDDISALFGIDNVVFEYLAFKPKDPSDAGVQSVLQLLQPRLAQIGTAKTAIGSTSNLETREIGVVSVYASDAELDTAKASAARKQLLADVAVTVDTTSVVAHMKKIIPFAEK